MSAQSVTLSDVHIEVENASVDAGFLGTLSAKRGGKSNAPQNVTLRAASIVGHGIKVEDPNINGGKPISVDSLQLDAFTLKANGSKELFEDAPNQASFSVGNAILQGIKTNKVAMTCREISRCQVLLVDLIPNKELLLLAFKICVPLKLQRERTPLNNHTSEVYKPTLRLQALVIARLSRQIMLM